MCSLKKIPALRLGCEIGSRLATEETSKILLPEGWNGLPLKNGGSCIGGVLSYTYAKHLKMRILSGKSPRKLVAFFTSIVSSMETASESGNTFGSAEYEFSNAVSTFKAENLMVGLQNSLRRSNHG